MQKIEDKKRYREKLALIDGDDPYAIPREEWTDKGNSGQLLPTYT